MPATTATQQIPGIVQWFQLYGNIVFFFAQLLWWIITGFAAGWAASVYYRVSMAKMKMYEAKMAMHGEMDTEAKASDKAKDEGDKSAAKDEKEKVDVDKFVE